MTRPSGWSGTCPECRAGISIPSWPSESIPCPGCGAVHGLNWRRVLPWYGLPWMLRPLLARIRGRREPSRFALLIGSRRTA